jgi:hypothetical protein
MVLSITVLLPAAAQLATDIVARLLLAALQRPHFDLNFVESMLADEHAAFYSMTSDQLESLLLAALQQDSEQHTQCLRGLCKLPSAAELSSTTVSRLLWAALKLEGWGCTWAVGALCQLPAVAQISPQEMVRLLEKLCSLCSTGAASWSAVNNLHEAQMDRYQTTSFVAEMLAAAVEYDAGAAMVELCSLPTAKRLSSAAVLPAIEAAVGKGSDWFTEKLCKLPAAQQLSSSAVEQLLQAAASHKNCMCRMLLLSLPAANGHSSSSAR